MTRNYLILIGALLALMLLSGCGEKETTREMRKAVSNLAPTDVAGAEYDLGMEGQSVVLEEGHYRSDPNDADMYLEADVIDAAYDDLDGDGHGDAAVLFGWTGGGSGYFTSLHILINENGQPLDLAQEPLGDRTKLNQISCVDGLIRLDMVVHGPDDPACCPTLHVIHEYRWDGVRINQVAADTVGVVR